VFITISFANFGELRLAEVQLRRIPLPRTPVNKGKKKGRVQEPRPPVVASECRRFGLAS
jgi:hypothetical protein